MVAAVVLEVVYLIAGNAFLHSEWGRGAINRRPDKLTASWSGAWTWLPGLVHLRGLELEGTGRRVAWRGSADGGYAWFWLPSLLNRHLRVVTGEIAGVEVDVDLLPEPDTPRKTGRGWRTTLGGLSVGELRRIRVGGYELAGDGALEGRARFQTRGPMQLRLRRLAFDDAVIRSGGTEVARRLILDASADTEAFRIGRDHLGTILSGLSGALDLHAEADSLGFLAVYLSKVPWLRLGGHGDLTIDASIDRGSLVEGSTLALTGPEVEAEFYGFRARGKGRVDAGVGEKARGIQLGARLDDFSVVRIRDGASILAGQDLETQVSTSSTDLAERPEDLSGWLRLPPAQVGDLSTLGGYLPPGLGVEIDGGTAELSADLSFDTAAGGGNGRLGIAAQHVTGSFDGASFTTSVTLDAVMPSVDLRAGDFDVSGSYLVTESTRLARAGVVRASDWWARVRVPAGRITLAPAETAADRPPAEPSGATEAPVRLASIVADLEADMRDSAPVVVLMEQRLPKLAWFDRLLTIPNVSLTGSLVARGQDLGLYGLHVVGGERDQLEIRAELDLDGAATEGVAYARYRRLAAALALSRGDRRWSVVRARQRYDEAVAEYTASRGGG